MLNPKEAKCAFRKNLLLLLATFIWPLIAGVVYMGLYATDFQSQSIMLLAFGAIGLALFIWLLVSLWKLAPEAGVTPWAALWMFAPGAGPFLIGMLFLEPLKYKGDNLPANKRLPLTWELIKESWQSAYKNYHVLSKTSVWFLYLFLIFGVSTALASVSMPYGVIHFFVFWAFFAFLIYFSIKLFLETMALESGKNLSGKEGETAKKFFGPTLWVAVLTFIIPMIPALILGVLGLVFLLTQVGSLMGAEGMGLGQDIAATMGVAGVVFAILLLASWIWAIYKFNYYGLVFPALLVDDVHGMAALKESERLVNNRWWGLFWKNQMWNVVLQSVMMVAMIVLSIIIGIIIVLFSNSGFQAPLAQFLSHAMNGVVYMLMTPLFTTFLFKLYKAFAKTA